MRYKAGDIIRIKSIEWYNTMHDKTWGFMCDGMPFMDEMAKVLCGKSFMIKEAGDGYYYIKGHGYMINDSRLMENFLKTRKIPITEISKNTKVDKKTLERHRKYLVAITLAYTNGYDIIRNHIKGINPKKEGENP